jgi:hypothetical protein
LVHGFLSFPTVLDSALIPQQKIEFTTSVHQEKQYDSQIFIITILREKLLHQISPGKAAVEKTGRRVQKSAQ